MFSFWQKKSSNQSEEASSLTWDDSATKALAQAVGQAPVPGIMKQRVKRELEQAAEEYARKKGKTSVSAEDLMQGIMSRLPEGMRTKVEDAAKQGPEGLKKLQDELK
ncbi:MAG: PCP reductase family protein [bacterium]|nr:PCP reductase family protein [bacterium]